MAFCQNCGKKLDQRAKFCPECGTAVNPSDRGRKTTYEGEVHKCPQCGETVDAFQGKCAACGYEFRNTEPSRAVKNFARELEKIYHYEKPKTFSNFLERALKRDDIESIRHEKAVAHIQSFAIPNNKEDIIEFLILASSNIHPDIGFAQSYTEVGLKNQEELSKAKELYNAWMAKAEQAYDKAVLMFQHDSDFYRIERIYNRITDKIVVKQQEIQKKKANHMMIVGLVVAAWFILLILSRLT